MYFSNFPKILYAFNLNDSNATLVTNIFSRFSIQSDVLDNAVGFYKYQIRDGDTPETVAYQQYGDPQLHWIVCLVNRLSDPIFDFPLKPDELERKIIKQYGYTSISEAYSAISHYVVEVKNTLVQVDGVTTVNTINSIVTLNQYNYTSNTIVTQPINTTVTSSTVFRANNSNANSAVTATLTTSSTYKPVYVYDYENELNESKRQIKLLKRQYVEPLISELEVVLNGGR